MADNSFTFWSNMKEAIDVYDDVNYKYRMYDAITEYGLYGIWPEDDGTKEAKDLICFVQSMVPTLDKSRNYNKNVAESGAIGGRKQKVSDEEIKQAVEKATELKNGIPTRQEVVDQIKILFDLDISTKTMSRRCDDEKKKEISLKYLEGHKDKINVFEGQNMSQGHGDIINVPGTKGQKKDIIDVPKVSNGGWVF